MAVDLKRLIEIRERHRCVAQQALVQEQRATEAQHAALQSAQAEWQRQVAARAQLWTDAARSADAGSSLSVSALRDMSAWSGSLDGGIVRAAQAAKDSERDLALQQARLEERRAHLRRAAGALGKAEALHERVCAESRGIAERRLDDAVDEAATQVWSSPRRLATGR